MASIACLLVIMVIMAARTQAMPPTDCTITATNHLICHLSSINSRLERTDFSVIPNTTISLTVVCSQTDIGSLPSSAFASLSRLQHLAIHGCVLERLPINVFKGLNSLTSLQVSTEAVVPILLEPGSLDHLPNLHRLDLSGSAIRNIPDKELCKLPQLNTFNISRNQLGSLHDLGITSTSYINCLPQLSSIDISHNELSMLEAGSIISWPLLTNIDLSYNYIRFVSESVFTNSTMLSMLNMANNQMSHLPESLFAMLPLRELQLANNSLSTLPSSLLARQTSLEKLNLSGNILMSSGLPHNFTADLFNLIELDLCSNQLAVLSLELTNSLQNLQILKLCSNDLDSIELSPAMVNLVDIDLSANSLTEVGPDSFSPFSQLTFLSLARNEISAIHGAAFVSTPQLLVLDLSDNKLFSLPPALRRLTALQTLDISNNFISEIAEDTLSVLTNLWRLQMNGNLVSNISKTIFANLASLQILDLSNNRIEQVVSGAFSTNNRLRAVRLDGNRLTTIENLFTNIPELIWLNVSTNSIKTFDYSFVPNSLSWLDISHNDIAVLDNYFNLQTSQISYLDASFNRLTKIESPNFPVNIETLLLNDNHISNILPYAFFHLTKLIKADLSVNEISSLSENSIRLSADSQLTPSFNLGGNPIACNCHMQWFQGVNEGTKLARYPHITDLESIYCQLMNTPTKTFVPLVEARPDQFLCEYKTHCFSLCQCCQFDSCDCEMTCPDGCSCYHDNSWTKNIIQCSNNEYTGLPTGMPMDATEISLDGNNLSHLRSHSLIGRKNLRVLRLNDSNIEKIENKTFNGLNSLAVLHLENNRLRGLEGFEFSGLHRLRELYLQDNLISNIHNGTFAGLNNLEILNLAGNALIDFPVWKLALNPYLLSIHVADNLWSCNCKFVQHFTAWMQVVSKRLSDLEEIVCVSNEATGPGTIKMIEQEERVCEDSIMAIAKTQVQEKLIENYLPLMIAILASFSMLVIFGFVIFSFRHSIRIWISSKNDDSRVLDSRLESPKSTYSETSTDSSQQGAEETFDAFVSYSPHDAVFVNQILGKDLEANCGYRLCLHHRDLPGTNACSETIGKTAESSRATILVLSSNYLATEWPSLDYRQGLLSVLQTSTDPVIVVLLGNQETALMYPGVRRLLAGHILLQWGEPQFWPKLQMSLPRVTQMPEDTNYYSICQFPPSYTKSENFQQMISHI